MKNTEVVAGSLYGSIVPIHPIRRRVIVRASTKWKCGCRECHANPVLTPGDVLKGLCPACPAKSTIITAKDIRP